MSCDGCIRTADWGIFSLTVEDSSLDRYENTIKQHLREILITDCFHFIRSEWEPRPDEKPAEYLFDIDYDARAYRAPTGGGVPNDKLYVYNSCDFARSDQYHLSRARAGGN